jgi:hypothetical protein
VNAAERGLQIHYDSGTSKTWSLACLGHIETSAIITVDQHQLVTKQSHNTSTSVQRLCQHASLVATSEYEGETTGLTPR